MSKESSKSKSVTLTPKEREEANAFFNQIAPDLSKDDKALGDLSVSPEGLEEIADKLTDLQKIVVNVILSDFSAENEAEAEKDVFKKLRNACARAGMLGTGKEADFFRTLADPKFNEIVKKVGCGLIGTQVLAVVSTVLNKAIVEGDKTCLKWCLEIMGLMPSKYDFYLNRYQMTHIQTGNMEINLDGKTDEELAQLVNDIEHGSEAVEVVS